MEKKTILNWNHQNDVQPINGAIKWYILNILKLFFLYLGNSHYCGYLSPIISHKEQNNFK